MQSGQRSGGRSLFIPASLFILAYFLLFSYDSLNTYLTFDDGMNLITMHHQWEAPLRRNVIEVLKVFTTANRPLGALFYRPMYEIFGFNPLAFRTVFYIMLMINIVIAHRFARRLGATTGAAALSTLLFAYNASLGDLFYNTGTIYDVLCFILFFPAFLLYVRERQRGRLSVRTMIIVMLLLLAALDAKEMAAMFVADLFFYELLFHTNDFKDRELLTRVGGFIAAVGIVVAIFLKVKVSDMQNNALYRPHTTLPFVLHGMPHHPRKTAPLHERRANRPDRQTGLAREPWRLPGARNLNAPLSHAVCLRAPNAWGLRLSTSLSTPSWGRVDRIRPAVFNGKQQLTHAIRRPWTTE